MNRKEAVEKSIELWTWLAETGKEKFEWEGLDRHLISDCFLCEFTSPGNVFSNCNRCPYYEEFGGVCFKSKSVYDKWENALSKPTRKKYATLFLEQLKSLEV